MISGKSIINNVKNDTILELSELKFRKDLLNHAYDEISKLIDVINLMKK